jgi:hypothetical protein
MNVQTNPEIELPPVGGAVAQKTNLPMEQSGDTLMNLIAKMATDTNCDVDKFERLVRLNIEVEKLRRDEILSEQFNEAMSRAQAQMFAIVKDKTNDQTRSQYASYAAFDRVIRPIYTAEGFSLTFNEGETAKPDYVRVLCDVAHGGYTRHYHVDMPADGKGAKGGDVMTKTHATGSAFTYGQRNLLKLIFNLATIDKDDDGNAAGATTISDAQLEELKSLIATIDAELTKAGIDKQVNVSALCKKVGAENIAGIPSKKYKTLTDSLRQWGRSEIQAAKSKKK